MNNYKLTGVIQHRLLRRQNIVTIGLNFCQNSVTKDIPMVNYVELRREFPKFQSLQLCQNNMVVRDIYKHFNYLVFYSLERCFETIIFHLA